MKHHTEKTLLLVICAATLFVGCNNEDPAPRAGPPPAQGALLDAPVPAPPPVSAAVAAPTKEASATPVSTKPQTVVPGTSPEQHAPNLAALVPAGALPEPAKIPGFAAIGFPALAGFDFEHGDPPAALKDPATKPDASIVDKTQLDRIPKTIVSLDGKKIAIQGFMIPIDFQDGGTNHFILMRSIPACLYCQRPEINSWVDVQITGGKRVPYVDTPLTVAGTIDIGPEFAKGGYVVSLYRLAAERVIPQPD
jgi:hypothetical protein